MCRNGDVAHLEAMKGVMSSSKGNDTYVVIFLRNLAECSKRWYRRDEQIREQKEEQKGVGVRKNRRHEVLRQNKCNPEPF